MRLEDKILEKIKHDNLKPTSIWYFLIKDYSLWLAVFVSIILAALSIAPIIFIISNSELGFIKHISSNMFLFILLILPYPWIILGCLTTYVAKKSWCQTKHGYKFEGKYVVIISILSSLILGILFNEYNTGKFMDEEAGQSGFGYYKSVEGRKQENWFSPADGRLIGIVQEISTTTFNLYNDKNHYTEVISFDETVPGQEFVVADNNIRVIGYENDNKDFFACAIFPDNFQPGKQREIRGKMQEKIK